MSAISDLEAVVARLLPFADVIEEIVQQLEAGADKQAILTAARAAAVAASDEAMKRAAGLPL